MGSFLNPLLDNWDGRAQKIKEFDAHTFSYKNIIVMRALTQWPIYREIVVGVCLYVNKRVCL